MNETSNIQPQGPKISTNLQSNVTNRGVNFEVLAVPLKSKSDNKEYK